MKRDIKKEANELKKLFRGDLIGLELALSCYDSAETKELIDYCFSNNETELLYDIRFIIEKTDLTHTIKTLIKMNTDNDYLDEFSKNCKLSDLYLLKKHLAYIGYTILKPDQYTKITELYEGTNWSEENIKELEETEAYYELFDQYEKIIKRK